MSSIYQANAGGERREKRSKKMSRCTALVNVIKGKLHDRGGKTHKKSFFLVNPSFRRKGFRRRDQQLFALNDAGKRDVPTLLGDRVRGLVLGGSRGEIGREGNQFLGNQKKGDRV